MVIAKYRCSAGGRFDQEVVELGSAVNGSAAPRSSAVNGSAGGRYARSAVGQLVPARSAGSRSIDEQQAVEVAQGGWRGVRVRPASAGCGTALERLAVAHWRLTVAV